jgi:hypothetical protein
MIFFSARVLRKLHELEACEANATKIQDTAGKTKEKRKEGEGKGRAGL